MCVGLLEYLYLNQVNFDQETSLELLKISEEYHLPKLKNTCEECLAKELNLNNLLKMVKVAEFYEGDHLKREAINFLNKFKKEVCPKVDISQFPKSVFTELFKKESDSLMNQPYYFWK